MKNKLGHWAVVGLGSAITIALTFGGCMLPSWGTSALLHPWRRSEPPLPQIAHDELDFAGCPCFGRMDRAVRSDHLHGVVQVHVSTCGLGDDRALGPSPSARSVDRRRLGRHRHGSGLLHQASGRPGSSDAVGNRMVLRLELPERPYSGLRDRRRRLHQATLASLAPNSVVDSVFVDRPRRLFTSGARRALALGWIGGSVHPSVPAPPLPSGSYSESVALE
mgnify:CR=1 FL=1